MSIKKIKITNFKSFKELDLELGKFNILIGSNASGKSNFLQIFKFLKDIHNSGLDNALQMQGGREYLTNLSISSSKKFSVQVSYDENHSYAVKSQNGLTGLEAFESLYSFAIGFNKNGSGFKIEKDQLIQSINFIKLEKLKSKIKEKETLGKGKIIYSRNNGKLNLNLSLPKGQKKKKKRPAPAIY